MKRQMLKVKVIILLVIMSLFYWGGTSYANENVEEGKITFKELDSEADVSIHKKWEITFDRPMKQKLFEKNILVGDRLDNLIPVTVESKDNGRKAVIHPPEGGYQEGNIYYIVITHYLSDQEGSFFSQPILKKFETEYSEEDIVEIPDPNLKDRLISQLDKVTKNVTKQDLKNIKGIDLSESDIKSLEGLEKAINLQELHMPNNQVSDLQPISQLKQLKYLNVRNNNITDLDPIKELSQLQVLYASQNKIKNLIPLAQLFNLRKLAMDSNNIENIEPLRSLGALYYISLLENPLSDEAMNLVNNLRQHVYTVRYGTEIHFEDPNLEEVVRMYQHIEKDVPIYTSDVDTLYNLEIYDRNIKSLEGIGELVSLRNLEISHNNITDYSPINKVKGLKSLSINNTDLKDLDFLKEMDQLEKLHLKHNRISDISELEKLENLTFLNLKGNKIEDLSVLSELNKVQNLILTDNNIKDLSVFQDLENDFYWLYLDDNQISDISPLVKMVKDKKYSGLLDISFNQLDSTSKTVQDHLSKLREQNEYLWAHFQMPKSIEEGKGILYGRYYSISMYSLKTQQIDVENAKVQLLNQDGEVVTSSTVHENGRFKTEQIPAGMYHIQFKGTHYTQDAPREVEVKSGKAISRDLYVFPLQIKGNVTIKGTQVKVKEYEIQLLDEEGQETDARINKNYSEFDIMSLSKGTYTLRINAEGFQPYEKVIDLKNNLDVQVELEPLKRSE
ncbi:leucine-rich repeat domain-containing protein [Pontibacillus sp. HMF3514]|uniref:leucine-rich repeat domain-containing protein n=1 Tax=Pontibacillus sp. HMF3514 TaxID=2692425 RepID=UPI00131FA052|nr:leucine-rich repeat domain-containing protein [Pontibacillus sp. HMF3514]QHE53680.1 PEGA domain-containing protein [Pontibacillus sp. HMF3514]